MKKSLIFVLGILLVINFVVSIDVTLTEEYSGTHIDTQVPQEPYTIEGQFVDVLVAESSSGGTLEGTISISNVVGTYVVEGKNANLAYKGGVTRFTKSCSDSGSSGAVLRFYDSSSNLLAEEHVTVVDPYTVPSGTAKVVATMKNRPVGNFYYLPKYISADCSFSVDTSALTETEYVCVDGSVERLYVDASSTPDFHTVRSLLNDEYGLQDSVPSAEAPCDFAVNEYTQVTANKICKELGYDYSTGTGNYRTHSSPDNNCIAEYNPLGGWTAHVANSGEEKFHEFECERVITCPGECEDGIDNDGDGFIDLDDLGCDDADDGVEDDGVCTYMLDSDGNGVNDTTVTGSYSGNPQVCVGSTITCPTGYSNCNSDITDGCEVNLSSSFLHCGSCGNTCTSDSMCVSGGCSVIGVNEWTNFLGDSITTANLGAYVRMVSPWAGQGNYTVFEDTNLFFSTPLAYFQIASMPTDSLRFNVSGNVDNSLSSELTVLPSTSNVPMEIEVLQPLCGLDLMQGDTREVRIRAADPDDLITGNVSVNGVKIHDFTNLNGPLIAFNYTFMEAGNTQVFVEAVNTHQEKFRSIVNIMVIDPLVDSDYVASCIDEPRQFDRFSSSTVRFRADSSRGIRFSAADYDPLVSGSGITNESLDDLYFSWRFFHLGTETFSCEGLGATSCFGVSGAGTMYDFVKQFSTVENNRATLAVSIL